jgi:hypothetical protein
MNSSHIKFDPSLLIKYDGQDGKNSDKSVNYINAHEHGVADAFPHEHNVCTEAVVASIRIHLHVLPQRFFRLGTRPSGKRRPMDPRCGAYGREGEDAEATWDGYAWWRTPPPPRFTSFTGADVCKMSGFITK